VADTTGLHANARSVIEAGAALGIQVDVSEFPEGTRTAADAARAIGVEVSQIVKSLIFRVDDAVVVALVSGTNRLDEDRLAAACGGGRVARADADAVRAATGYPIGGVPPFGHATPLPTYVDPDLLRHGVVWAAAGTPHHVFPITPDELARVTGGVVTDLAAT
jgi:Cys-tRNA(Pro) deacylase